MSDDFLDPGAAGFDGLDELFVEPRPDEDAWEAYLDLALERIEGERGPGLTLQALAELEEVIGVQLPFEIGMLLIMGVPTDESWHQWQDPAADWARWNDKVRGGISHDVEHNDFWFDTWGAKPASVGAQLAVVEEQFATTIPPLLPLYNERAVPLVAAKDQPSSDGNPVLSIHRAGATIAGVDLADWMHKEFEVPLPMWPTDDRTFEFWSGVQPTS